jgi:hypothetical protein
VYKLDSFVGFIGDEQFHAQECYELISSSAFGRHQIWRWCWCWCWFFLVLGWLIGSSKWGNLHVLEITANSSAVVSTWPVFRVPCY